MRTLLLLVGLPGSGKSTFSLELLKKEPKRWKRINRDCLRAMLNHPDDREFSSSDEDLVRHLEKEAVRRALKEGFDVILDNTHLKDRSVKDVHKLCESVGDVKVIEKPFNVDVAECLRRNAGRTGRARVPDSVIERMARAAKIDKGHRLESRETYYPPRVSAPARGRTEGLPDAIICDLDGTLALMGDRSPFDASRCDELDTLNEPVARMVDAFNSQGVKVIFMSGRSDKDRAPTVRFIDKHMQVPVSRVCKAAHNSLMKGGKFKTAMNYQLFMRAEGDMRKDAVVKRELFEAHVEGRYNVILTIDDRDQVVDLWRSMGLTCAQVNYGDF